MAVAGPYAQGCLSLLAKGGPSGERHLSHQVCLQASAPGLLLPPFCAGETDADINNSEAGPDEVSASREAGTAARERGRQRRSSGNGAARG